MPRNVDLPLVLFQPNESPSEEDLKAAELYLKTVSKSSAALAGDCVLQVVNEKNGLNRKVKRIDIAGIVAAKTAEVLENFVKTLEKTTKKAPSERVG